MKVLAINGSPRKEKGNTALILTPFLEGIKKAGAEVDLYYTADLNINPCKGDYSCWFRTPGRCIYDDDMNLLMDKMHEMDVLVIASPVYSWGLTGPMKIVLDRTVARVQPFVEIKDGHMQHIRREGSKPHQKVVLVSNCGLWEEDNFDPLLAQIKAKCTYGHMTFAGALLRPHGPALRAMMDRGLPVNHVTDAAQMAGVQLIKEGVMSQELLETVRRPLMPKEAYLQVMNQNFSAMLASAGHVGKE